MSVVAKEKMIPQQIAPGLYKSLPMRGLVVDDNAYTLNVVHRMLEASGFMADKADGGHTAKHCLNRSQYDFVVTDLQMPDLDGHSLAVWIKNNSPDTKVVIMTGAHHSEVSDFMNANIADSWLFKPFSMGELSGTLDALV